MEGDFVMGMGEDEIMQRAREAAIIAANTKGNTSYDEALRAGKWDDNYNVTAVAQALRDYHRPLSEIAPVNPDLALASEVCAEVFERMRHLKHIAERYRNGKYDEGDLAIYIALTMATRIRAEMAK
jgi:hypothetical protein